MRTRPVPKRDEVDEPLTQGDFGANRRGASANDLQRFSKQGYCLELPRISSVLFREGVTISNGLPHEVPRCRTAKEISERLHPTAQTVRPDQPLRHPLRVPLSVISHGGEQGGSCQLQDKLAAIEERKKESCIRIVSRGFDSIEHSLERH